MMCSFTRAHVETSDRATVWWISGTKHCNDSLIIQLYLVSPCICFPTMSIYVEII